MKPINIEKLMNHSCGISDNYYRITEAELLEDYLKAIDLLTINSDKLVLQKQVLELKEKSRDDEYIIKAKLQEKENQIDSLIKKQEQFEVLIQSLIDSGQLQAYNKR
jgi:DNA-binding PadR family transcriptional regulator